MKKKAPHFAAFSGLLTGVVCLGFVLLAHRLGLQLSELLSDALIFGGLASMGVGAAGARFMPVKDEQK